MSEIYLIVQEPTAISNLEEEAADWQNFYLKLKFIRFYCF
jgi:hypothetical protein